MGYDGGYQPRFRFGGMLTPAVKALLMANAAVFLVQLLLIAVSPGVTYPAFMNLFRLRPADAIGRLQIWQFVTYSFLHDPGGFLPWHIIFNMFLLWMVGGDVELTIGRRRFLWLYFAAALAGGLCMIPMYRESVLGASGAVFGVMALFARLFPDRLFFVWGIFPVRARTLVFVLVGLDLFFAMRTSGGSRIAHFAHVGGFVVGWFFLSWESAVTGFKRAWEARKAIRAEAEARKMMEKVDELLAKVGREGLGSLTKRERGLLSRASRRLRR